MALQSRPPAQQQKPPPQGQQQEPEKEKLDLRKHLEARIPYLTEIASGMVDPKKVISTALMMVYRKGNEKLAEAAWENPKSLLFSLLQLTELNLDPDGVEAALIPYKGEVTAQPMYQGLIKLLYGSGMVKDVYADIAYANEIATGRFRYQKGSKPFIHHEPLFVDRGASVGAYAVMHLMTGGVILDFMPAEEIAKAKAVSKSASREDGPWVQWPMEQWKKTVLKRISKVGPKSDSLRKALALDYRDVIEGEGHTLDEDQAARGGVEQLQRIVNRGLPSPTQKERIETSAQRQTVPAERGSQPSGEDPSGDDDPPAGREQLVDKDGNPL